MRLISVYENKGAVDFLYRLLAERESFQSISHVKMPSWEEHVEFVNSRPYPYWYLIFKCGFIGSCYLTDRREIGIWIAKSFQRNGYAEKALRLLMDKHPGKFLANINPQNEPSASLFQKLGFKLIQHTYSL